jgi:hypothetical protein
VDNEEQLQNLYDNLKSNGATIVAFHEPHYKNQMTSLCYYGTPVMRKLMRKSTPKLELALKNEQL